MRKQFGFTAAIVVTLAAAACSKPATPDSGLSRDLQLAGSADLALSPNNGRTEVVSAVERAPEAKPAPRPASPTPQAVRRPQHHPAAVASPVPAAPAPVAVAAVPAASPPPVPEPNPAVNQYPASPRPTPVQQPRQHAPPGGWRTIGDVIRNAPFPINP